MFLHARRAHPPRGKTEKKAMMFLYARRAHRARAARLINVKNVSHARRRIAGVAGNSLDGNVFLHAPRTRRGDLFTASNPCSSLCAGGAQALPACPA